MHSLLYLIPYFPDEWLFILYLGKTISRHQNINSRQKEKVEGCKGKIFLNHAFVIFNKMSYSPMDLLRHWAIWSLCKSIMHKK